MPSSSDSGPDESTSWFIQESERNPILGNPITDGNDIQFFIEYRDYYRALAEAISRATGESHFIYFVDWQLILDTWMDTPKGRMTFQALLKGASDNKVQIRALLYSGQALNDPVHNHPMADWINKLPTGGAILDWRYLDAGSHHQKMVIILNEDGVVGFCGGMDIAEDRQKRDGGPKPPKPNEPVAWHDVQVRIKGPAAYHLWRTFYARWADNPLSQKDFGLVNQRSIKIPPFAPAGTGQKRVQVVRTSGNGSRHAGLKFPEPTTPSTYYYAPTGEMTIYKLLCKAIKSTKEYIYLEDQYLVESERMGNNPSIAEVLASTLARSSFKQMIILLPGAGSLQGELFQVWRRRTRFWQQLGPKAASKVAIYSYVGDPESPYLVHSKTWIFDDRFAVIGSANCNRRGYSHDSEIAVGIFDLEPKQGQLPFAQELRVSLWMKHLNRKGKQRTRAELIDFRTGAALWEESGALLTRIDLVHPTNEPPDHHISPWLSPSITLELPAVSFLLSSKPSLKVALFDWDREWNWLIDPDGA